MELPHSYLLVLRNMANHSQLKWFHKAVWMWSHFYSWLNFLGNLRLRKFIKYNIPNVVQGWELRDEYITSLLKDREPPYVNSLYNNIIMEVDTKWMPFHALNMVEVPNAIPRIRLTNILNLTPSWMGDFHCSHYRIQHFTWFICITHNEVDYTHAGSFSCILNIFIILLYLWSISKRSSCLSHWNGLQMI